MTENEEAAARSLQWESLSEAEAARQKAAKEALEARAKNAQAGGYSLSEDMVRRMEARNYGMQEGEKFFQDPYLQKVRSMYEGMSKGYDSGELGAMREEARGQIRGAQEAAMRGTMSQLGRGGVGGARAAAMLGTQQQQGARNIASAERQMALDSAQMKRQGQKDYAGAMERHLAGKYGTAAVQQQLGSSDYSAEQARMANQKTGKK